MTVVCDLTQERTSGWRVGWCYRDGRDIAAAPVGGGGLLPTGVMRPSSKRATPVTPRQAPHDIDTNRCHP